MFMRSTVTTPRAHPFSIVSLARATRLPRRASGALALAGLALMLLAPACARGGGAGESENGARPGTDVPDGDVDPQTRETAHPGEAIAPADLARETAAVVEGNTRFAWALFDRLRQEEGNLVYSPFSISTALAMTLAGAAGDTREEMRMALRFPALADLLHQDFAALLRSLRASADTSGYTLAIANRLWGQTGHDWLQPFVRVTREEYGAEMAAIPMRTEPEPSRARINEWVAEQTRGRIEELLPRGTITADTRLVLTNAVYFKGAWESPFDSARTQPAPFTREDGTQIEVPMMQQEGAFPLAQLDGVQLLSLPYEGERLRMVFLLPAQAGRLAELEARISEETLGGWIDQLSPSRVRVRMPRFRFSSSFRLEDALSAMGMPSAFDAGAADFSDMDGTRELFLSAVVHEAFVQVNEEGTEAAAATGGVVGVVSMPPVFDADHPFVFVIRDEWTGTILFVGRVADPSA